MKYYKQEIERLKKLTPEERQEELLTKKRELGAFINFLQEIAEDTNEPELYNDLLTELTAYYAYGLEMVGEAVGVVVDTSTERHIEALALAKAEGNSGITS